MDMTSENVITAESIIIGTDNTATVITLDNGKKVLSDHMSTMKLKLRTIILVFLTYKRQESILLLNGLRI